MGTGMVTLGPTRSAKSVFEWHMGIGIVALAPIGSTKSSFEWQSGTFIPLGYQPGLGTQSGPMVTVGLKFASELLTEVMMSRNVLSMQCDKVKMAGEYLRESGGTPVLLRLI